MNKIAFGTPIEPMGPYYGEVDLNDKPVSQESQTMLETLLAEAGGSLACELKEDGFRCQVHVDGSDIRLFSRGAGEFEPRCFPEIIESLGALGLEQTILDGELRGSAGKYGGFKAMQARARYRDRISEKALREYLKTKPQDFPVQLVVFDMLMHQGTFFLEEPNASRRCRLEEAIADSETILPVSRTLVKTPQEIAGFYAQKVQKEKYEGLVLKQPRLEYIPGDKKHWVKLKKFEPLDLVILGLSHQESKVGYTQALVGSYLPERDVYQSLGFVNLRRQNPATGNLFAEDLYSLLGKKRTAPSKNVEIGSRKPEVYIDPSVVVEVRVMNIDRGKDFTCSVDGKTGYSLRTAYIKSIREDKAARQATTTEFVAAYHRQQR